MTEQEKFELKLNGFLRGWFKGISKEEIVPLRQNLSASFDRPLEERMLRLTADLLVNVLPTIEEEPGDY